LYNYLSEFVKDNQLWIERYLMSFAWFPQSNNLPVNLEIQINMSGVISKQQMEICIF